MSRYNTPFEIHVHGDVPLRADVTFEQLQEALKPLWKYAGSKSLAAGAASAYEEEPGIQFDVHKHLLQMCWTVSGDEDFRQALDEMCMGLNDLAEMGAPIEVTFYDSDFDDEEEGADDEEARDDFAMYFVGPTPAAIMQVQRDLLVQDMISLQNLAKWWRLWTACLNGALIPWSIPCSSAGRREDPVGRRAGRATAVAVSRGICTRPLGVCARP
jgi:hypothetical protein